LQGNPRRFCVFTNDFVQLAKQVACEDTSNGGGTKLPTTRFRSINISKQKLKKNFFMENYSFGRKREMKAEMSLKYSVK
jgi:hypothetical protein